jgi:opacity protein-like surface antigen
VLIFFLALLFPTALRAQDKFEVFGGYSYFRASVTETGVILCPGPPCPTSTVTGHPNLNGWEASAEYKPFNEIGLVADFGGNYGSLPRSMGGGSMHTNTYLFGPRVSLPGRVSPFVHVLAGAAHQSTSPGTNPSQFFFPAHSTNAFAIALGGGVDVKLTPLVRLRLVQLDYVGSKFGLSFHSQARISSGLVFHF